MYLYPWKLVSRRSYAERIRHNQHYKKLLPLIRRCTLVFDRTEQSTDDLDESSLPRLQVVSVLLLYTIHL